MTNEGSPESHLCSVSPRIIKERCSWEMASTRKIKLPRKPRFSLYGAEIFAGALRQTPTSPGRSERRVGRARGWEKGAKGRIQLRNGQGFRSSSTSSSSAGTEQREERSGWERWEAVSTPSRAAGRQPGCFSEKNQDELPRKEFPNAGRARVGLWEPARDFPAGGKSVRTSQPGLSAAAPSVVCAVGGH